jgi:catechol 2,3-dioxygenase-like lactoylglutathione lyase family enzyme
MRIHHVALQVTDLERARSFYAGVLGFAVTREQAHALWLDADGSIVMLERCDGVVDAADAASWASPRQGPFVVAFAVTPTERAALRARLTAAGVAIDHESAYTLYVRDPFGARLAFSHYPDAPTPPTGPTAPTAPTA